MLQVVVLPVDHVDALPGLLVLDVLILKDVLDGVQLPLHVQLTPLHVVGVQHGHPGQIHQGADVIDALKDGAAEGGVGGDKGQIAHQKAGNADHHRGPQLLHPKGEGGGRVLPAAGQPAHRRKHKGVDCRQKDQRQGGGAPGVLGKVQGVLGVGPQLPLQRGGELCSEEGAGGEVAHSGQRHAAAGGDEGEHQPHRPHHAGEPQGDMQAVGQAEEQALDRQPKPQHSPQPEAGTAQRPLAEKDQTGAPLGNGGKQAGDIGEIDLIHPLIPPT